MRTQTRKIRWDIYVNVEVYFLFWQEKHYDDDGCNSISLDCARTILMKGLVRKYPMGVRDHNIITSYFIALYHFTTIAKVFGLYIDHHKLAIQELCVLTFLSYGYKWLCKNINICIAVIKYLSMKILWHWNIFTTKI